MEAVGDRQQAFLLPVVLGEREESRVRLEKGIGGLVALRELELQLNRVRLQVDEAVGLAQLRQGLGSPMQVHDQLRRPEQTLEAGLRHAIAAAIRVQGPK